MAAITNLRAFFQISSFIVLCTAKCRALFLVNNLIPRKKVCEKFHDPSNSRQS